MREGCMDIISTYTDAQTIANYTNKIVLNYVCYTHTSVTTNPSVCYN